MIHEIEKERKSAEHLFYVSLKYTRTGDIIINLIKRWCNMISNANDVLLKTLKKKKKIKKIPTAPKLKEQLILKNFKKNEIVKETLELYSFLRHIGSLTLIREHEFRKNVTLRVLDKGREVIINMEKLKEWQKLFDKFIKFVKSYVK